MNKFFLAFIFLLAPVFTWAGTVHLVNDSPFLLRAIITGADGTFLGEMVLNPEHSMRWTDTYGQVGYYGSGNNYQAHSRRSQTPYVVHWQCMNGGEFSVSTNVSTGGTATALTGEGRRICVPAEAVKQEAKE